MKRVTRQTWIGLIALLAAVLAALLLGGCGGSSGDKDNGPTATPLPGTVLDPPRDVADFTLTDQTGSPMKLSDLGGKVAVLFFGYTFCPDICPTTLSDFKLVKRALGDDAAQVAFVFISVDGERDTPERLAQYVGAFDPDFIGLTGDEPTLRQIAQDYGVFFQRTTYDNTQADYLVDHTASSFVVGPDSRLHIVIPYDTDPEVIAQRIKTLLKS